MIADYRTAVEKGDEEERRWASQHLNVEIGLALHDDRWPGVDFWEQAAAPGLTLDDLLAQCDVATIGIDGGGLDDLLGLAVIGRHAKTRHWLLWTKAWAHPIVLQRRKEIAETLRDFAKDGDLVFCTHSTQDIEEVAALCVRVRESKLLPERMGIGLDKLGLPGLIDALIDSGFDTDANEGTITGIIAGRLSQPGDHRAGAKTVGRHHGACRPAADGVVRVECQGRAQGFVARHHQAGGRHGQDRPVHRGAECRHADEPQPGAQAGAAVPGVFHTLKDFSTMQKVYSTFQVKAVDDEARLITGIASTPSTDRMGDVVEPKGAQFTLPMPLLWQHRADSPIGMITDAKVGKDGIEIAARIAKGVHADIDKAWSLIKAGLVRGLSHRLQGARQRSHPRQLGPQVHQVGMAGDSAR